MEDNKSNSYNNGVENTRNDGWESLSQNNPLYYKVGAKVLSSANFQERHAETMEHSLKEASKHREKLSGPNSDRRNEAYLKRLDAMIHDGGRDFEKRLWDYSVQKLIVQPEEISEKYWDSYRQHLRDEGFGNYDISESQKEAQVRELQKIQRESLEPWANYLSDENSIYPNWFKVYVFDGLSKMTKNYNANKNIFEKRTKGDVQPYPKLNTNALGKVYEAVADFYDLPNSDLAHNGQDRDDELRAIVKTGNFNKLYSKILSELAAHVEVPERTEDIDGEWIEYKLGDEDKIAEAAEGTPWCVASPRVANGYLTYGRYAGENDYDDDDYDDDFEDEDDYERDYEEDTDKARFIFFHLKNEAGLLSEGACASIRLGPDGNVAEISGLLDGQALNDSLVPIVEEKVKTLPGGERFLQAFADKKELIRLDKKMQRGETDFSQDDIDFIFENKRKITMLNSYQTDPRASEIKIFLLENINPPDGFVVDGSLDLQCETPIRKLPEKLKVQNDFYLRGAHIASWPKDLEVGGSLLLDGSNTTTLPEKLKVGGELELSGTPIASLPEGTEVGSLCLSVSKISILPKTISIKKDLIMRYVGDIVLPEELTLNGMMDLSNSEITSLPKILKVGRFLDISYTPITELPEGIEVGWFSSDEKTSESANVTNENNLPNDVNRQTVRRMRLPSPEMPSGLNISHTGIAKLPKGMRIKGDLDLTDTPISSLPEDLVVEGSITMPDGTSFNSLSELREELRSHFILSRGEPGSFSIEPFSSKR